MKKRLFTYLLLLSSLAVFSQSSVYHPFPQCYAAWRENEWVLFSPQLNYNYYVAGDTLINSQTYHIIRRADSASDTYEASIREDGSKHVYIWTGSGDELFYDFSLNVGDEMQPSYVLPAGGAIDGIDSVLVGSSYRKRFLIGNLRIIEGIGSDQDLFGGTNSPSHGYSLCFSQNGTTLYSNGPCNLFKVDTTKCVPLIPVKDSGGIPDIIASPGITIFPNPASGYVTIEYGIQLGNINQLETQELIVTDELGQNIRSANLNSTSNIYTMDLHGLSNGVYFVIVISNKKVVAEKKLVVVQPQ
jgi:hypothetical protein